MGRAHMAITPGTVTGPTVSTRQRVLAILALGADLLLLVAVLVFLLNHGVELVIALLGLAIAVVGGWWTVTEQMPRRGFGIAGLVLGFVLIVLAILRAAATTDQGLLRIAILAVLFAVAGVAARAALVADLHGLDSQLADQRWRPQHPVLICNPWSGGGKVEKFGLLERARELGVETVLLDHGLDLEQLARDAIAGGADCLGMAGGDGSQALVASIAIEHDIPFVCVTAGTRNHFALDLGLDREDPRASMDAFHDAVERRIDYATVGDRLFVNNVSLGMYATIVQQDSYRDAKAETSRALLPEMLGSTAEPFDLQFTTPDGTEVDGAFLIMVSNNPYVLGPSVDVSQRRSLETGNLGVFAVNAASGPAAARLMAASAVGLRARDPGWHEFTCETFEVRSRSGSAFAGVDGEALDLNTPLRFRIHPGGLRVLVPTSNLEVAARRRARNVSVGALFAVARGKTTSANETVEV
jgi:diacylglycerol kinase family enzyme